MKKEMPNVFGKESKKKELVSNLGEIYLKIEREHQISPGDFPNLRKMQVGIYASSLADDAKSGVETSRVRGDKDRSLVVMAVW